METTASRLARAYPGLQQGRRAGLAPVVRRPTAKRRRASARFGWVQPADEGVTINESYVLTGVTGNYVSSADFPAEAEATMGRLRTVNAAQSTVNVGSTFNREGSGTNRPTATQSSLIIPAITMPPVSPSPPPGMSVEYETAEGVFLSGTIDATVARAPQPETVTLRQIPASSWDRLASFYGLTYFTPAELAAMTLLATIPTGADIGYSFTQPFSPDADGGFACVLAFARQVSGTGWTVAEGGAIQWDDVLTTVSYTYRPPRYRFV